MAFRAEDSARMGYEEAEDYLVGRLREISDDQREDSRDTLRAVVNDLGPAVTHYPTWHPLVTNHDEHHPTTIPGERCGYNGLDHTRFFVNGFITCPYGNGAEKVFESVQRFKSTYDAHITAEPLHVNFYSKDATPILVKCDWSNELSSEGQIPLRIALRLLLEKEVPCARWSAVGETWETMRSYFLGAPRGSRSSLFVSQETGQAIKKVWETLSNTGMFGPIKV